MSTTPHAALFTDDETKLQPGWKDEQVTAVFAHTAVDLTRAPPADDARLALTAIFADIRLVVPKGTHVEMDGVSVFGRRHNDTEPQGATLHVTSTAVFGNVHVVEAATPAQP